MTYFAKIISYLFHPLTILTYTICILLLINPYLFGKSDISQGGWLILQVFLTTFLMPAGMVMMMKNLGLVKTLEMEERTDRILPYIMSGLLYLWVFMSVKSNNTFPQLFSVAVLGATIGLFLSFFFNNFTKISAHATGMGGLVGMMLITLRWFAYSYFYWSGMSLPVYWVFIAVLLVAGIVCSSRLVLKAHEPRDILQGFIVGLVGMWIAAWWLI